MSICPSCNNDISLNDDSCFFCGSHIHGTTNIFFNKKRIELASTKDITHFQRVSASVIDCLFIGIPIAVTLFFYGIDYKEFQINDISLSAFFIAGVLIALQTYFLIHDGQSVGKKCMKIAIVDNETNEHPTIAQLILFRTIVPLIPFIIPIIGVPFYLINILAGFRKEKRCLHDILAGTKVVHE